MVLAAKRGRLTWLFVAALAPVVAGSLSLSSTHAAEPGPGLMVTPLRVVFEGDKRTAAVNLVNAGTETGTYRIGFVQRRMREDGSLEAIEAPGPGERFADRLVRFSPRAVTLAPGGQQTVRLLLRKPAGLEPGEYRSHLLFQIVPSEASGTALEALLSAPSDSSHPAGASIRLTPIFGMTIPVIVRHGATSARVSLSDLRWELDPATGAPRALTLRIGRTGNRSVYGDVTVSLLTPDGREQPIGSVKGVAVYTPNAYRRLKVPVQLPPGRLPHGARLQVTYRNGEESGDPILAQTQVALP